MEPQPELSIAAAPPQAVPDEAEDHDITQDDSEREATELRAVSRAPENKTPSPISTSQPRPNKSPLTKFWRNNIRISVPHVASRDHLANERTFLAYLRTSLAFSFLAILIAQLFRLQHSAKPNAVFGFYVVGLPLSLAFQSASLIICIAGCFRYFRQQHAMSTGKVHAGGWEPLVVSGLAAVLLVGLFSVLMAVVVYKDVQADPP